GRTAFGARRQVGRWQADGGRELRGQGSEEQDIPPGSHWSQVRQDSSADRVERREQEPRAELAQLERRRVGGRQCGAPVSPAALRQRGDCASGAREDESGGGVMKSAYQILRKPVITEKGLGVKETESTLVFEVAANATKTEIKEAVQKTFKVKVDSIR